MSASDVIELNHSFKLIIPTQCICGEAIDSELRQEVLLRVENEFYSWFGGVTVMQGKGLWRLPDRSLANEDVDILESLASDDAFEDYIDDAKKLAVSAADELFQDCVLLKIDGKGTFWGRSDPEAECPHHGEIPATPPDRKLEVDATVDPVSIYYSLSRFSSVRDARHLFCNVLNYKMVTADLPIGNWPQSTKALLKDKEIPEVIADTNGFRIVYLRLAADRLLRGPERQIIQRIYQDDPTFRGLFVVSDESQENWEFVNSKTQGEKTGKLLLRRIKVGTDAVRTATERIIRVQIYENEENSITAADLQLRHDEAFDVEAVTKQFFNEIANWYFWACRYAEFPKDAPKEKDGRDHVSVIRLITRLVFCWFVKEKGLIPTDLFNERKLADLLIGFAPGKVASQDSVFYKAILQNLFFATLNTEMNKRGWRRNEQNFMAHSLYRHKDLFIRPDKALALFKNIPFLNGGLFECLDKILGDKGQPHHERIDGFSDRQDSQPTVPDFLFFGQDCELDLSAEYGDKRFRKVLVRGLIHTLNHYRFTVEESTPLEEEVALDPELAGKIFENLLAAYNPETGVTARKQTGSFYTPRGIVNYMVDDAIIACLKGKLEETFPKAADIESRLQHVFSYDKEGHCFTAKEVEVLIAGIDQLKALDPAVGSGAFPMGILHKLVFILGRLDPGNEMWKERQQQRLRDAMAIAERIEDATIRENTLKELEKQIAGIEEAFEKNTLDYGRKLYLIENCLYGVDIQPIAVQIAKMRFFISLIADQKVDQNAENLGVRPLPNLETKLVAANTLIIIDKPKQMRLRNPRIDALEPELRRVRERHFLARTPKGKAKCQEDDHKLRLEIAKLLKKDGWGDKTAKQLAGWDPYDQNSSAGFFDPEWMFGVRDGFDVVMGNPPYLRVQGLQQTQAEYMDYYRKTFQSAKGSFDLYGLFIERGYQLLAEHGQFAYIVPHKFFQATFGKTLRRLLTKRKALRQIVRFGSEQVFDEATTYTCLLFLSAQPSTEFALLEVNTLARGDEVLQAAHNRTDHPDYAHERLPAPVDDGKKLYWNFSVGEHRAVLSRLQQHRLILGDITRKIFVGLQTSADKIYVLEVREDSKDTVLCYSKHLDQTVKIERGLVKPFLMGKDVHRYQPVRARNVVIFPYDIVNGKAKLMSKSHIKRNFPMGWKYLKRNQQDLGGRERGRMHGDEFYAYIYPKNLVEFETSKIMTPEIALGCQMTLDTEGVFYHTTKVYSFAFKPEVKASPKFFLGLLNSRVLWYFLSSTGYVLRGGYYTFKTEYLKPFPIATSTPKQERAITKLVDKILAAKARDPNADTTPWEREIDEIVYKLYGLTKAEIKIVEKG